MHLKDLKKKTPAELVAMAEELGVEGASTLRKQDLMFAILKVQADNGDQIMGEGTIEVLPDGFGFLRSLVRIKPEPLTAPLHASHGLNPETEDIIARERAGVDG